MHEEIKKCFPDYQDRFTRPPQAVEQELVVYRACPTRKVERDSFLDSFEENNFEPDSSAPENYPSSYALSTYIKLTGVKRFVIADSKFQPPWALAKGKIVGCCGPCCLSSEWAANWWAEWSKGKTDEEIARYPSARKFINKKKDSSLHVDWWLYKDARPWEHFEEISYETEHKLVSACAAGSA